MTTADRIASTRPPSRFVPARGGSRALLIGLHRAGALFVAAPVVLMYALFAFTAIWSGEYPHTHGVDWCPNHPIPEGEVFYFVPSTFDPKGYGMLYAAGFLGLMAAPIGLAIQALAAIGLGVWRVAPQLRWNVVAAAAVAAYFLAVPLGVLAWWYD